MWRKEYSATVFSDHRNCYTSYRQLHKDYSDNLQSGFKRLDCAAMQVEERVE